MNDLVLIKKYYGEKMMHLCKRLFPTILEDEGALFKCLDDHFAHSKQLYDDIVRDAQEEEFKNYIFSFFKKEPVSESSVDNPYILMSKAGYNLYECKTESEIQSFKKYYERDEEICTFWMNRLNRCFVFFATKKNVDKIKRKDFTSPKRQDEYGTSVISIQFGRGNVNTLSIKNRYNHKVNNPDATFSNNLDNIIPGLTKSFEKYFGFNLDANDTFLELKNYIKADDGKYYRYNYEIAGTYYCDNNIIIDNNSPIKKFADKKERYLVFDYFILDLHKKKLYFYDDRSCLDEDYDSFINFYKNIENIKIVKDSKKQRKIINIRTSEGKSKIILNNYNQIIGYENECLKNIDNNFLRFNLYLEDLKLPNVLKIGDCFLNSNQEIKNIDLSSVFEIGARFLYDNRFLKEISLPKLVNVDDNFLFQNIFLDKVDMPLVQYIGNNFLTNNRGLKEISFPSVKEIMSDFIEENKFIEKVDLPNLEYVGPGFLFENEKLKELELLKVKKIGSYFLKNNLLLEKINLPNVIEIDSGFLSENIKLDKIDLPNVIKIGDSFLCSDNSSIKDINLPNVKDIGYSFLRGNRYLSKIDLPNVENIEINFLFKNTKINEINVPKLKEIRAVKHLLKNSIEMGDEYEGKGYRH